MGSGKKLLRAIEKSLRKLKSRRFDKIEYLPVRHRFVAELVVRGKLPLDAVQFETTKGRTFPSRDVRVVSEPGASSTRYVLDTLVSSIVDAEQLIATISYPNKTRTCTQRIKLKPQNLEPSAAAQTDPEVRAAMIGRDRLEQLAEDLASVRKDEDFVPTANIAYFPKFTDAAELTNHYHRAAWYFTGDGSPVEDITFGLEQVLAPDGPPDYFATYDVDPDIRSLVTDDAEYREHCRHAGAILLWKPVDTADLAWLKKRFPDTRFVSVATDDPASVEYGGYCDVQWFLLPREKRQTLLDESAARLRARVAALRDNGRKEAVVFGTGPSIETAYEYDFSNCVSIVCNTVISSPELMAHIKPAFVCAGDVVSHFGVSRYADTYRQDLVALLGQGDVYFMTTCQFGYLIVSKHPELAERIILCEQTANGPVVNLPDVFALPKLDSTLNIHMLPLAAAVSDNIFVLGCDGKNPNPDKNEDFWAHSSLAQYHDLVETGHQAHPTFDINRQRSTHKRYVDSSEKSFLAGEVFKKRYAALYPSFTPALKARPMPPHMIETSDTGLKVINSASGTMAAPRRRVLMVSRANPVHFSGGRYHSLILAEAMALGGDDVVLWLDNMPSWYHNLAVMRGHGRIKLHINDHNAPPQGTFDVVLVVPDHTPDASLYTQALTLARDQNARLLLINFESPNWFNAMSPAPKPLDNWQYWYATGAFSDAIMSLADVGTTYAREFYDQAPAACVFDDANPAINAPVADLVRARGIPAENQIISISRFGKGTEHKNVTAITNLMSEATRGYCLALIVGTGAYPTEAQRAALQDALDPYDMTLKLLYNISDVEKFEEIARSRVMIFQSLFEGFGYPPVEAQYMDRPCIAYDLPVLREFSDGAVRFVPLGDEAAMKAALAEELATELAADGALHSRVTTFATPEALSAKVEAILEKVATHPVPAAQAYEAEAFVKIAAGLKAK